MLSQCVRTRPIMPWNHFTCQVLFLLCLEGARWEFWQWKLFHFDPNFHRKFNSSNLNFFLKQTTQIIWLKYLGSRKEARPWTSFCLVLFQKYQANLGFNSKVKPEWLSKFFSITHSHFWGCPLFKGSYVPFMFASSISSHLASWIRHCCHHLGNPDSFGV